MNTKERIQQLEEELRQLKRECEKEPEFKVGDWVVIEKWPFVFRITRINGDRIIGEGMDEGFWRNDEYWCNYERIDRKATKQEIEEALRKEWVRRCKEKGYRESKDVVFKCLLNSEWEKIHDGTIEYMAGSDSLWAGCGKAYWQGKWAEIKPKKADKFFNWDVEYDGLLVNIGCKKYLQTDLIMIANALSHVEEYSVNEVIHELNKLDI